jgi:hypothetical protein
LKTGSKVIGLGLVSSGLPILSLKQAVDSKQMLKITSAALIVELILNMVLAFFDFNFI